MFGVGFDEEIERIDHRKVDGQIDLDLELAHLLGKNEARLPIVVRVLLPVHEMIRRRHLEAIGKDFGAAVGRGAKPHDLRSKRGGAIVFVMREVINRGRYGQLERPGPSNPPVPPLWRGGTSSRRQG